MRNNLLIIAITLQLKTKFYILCDLILDIAHEITKLIKKSPQRKALFNALKVQLLIDSVAQVFLICACKMDYTCRLLG